MSKLIDKAQFDYDQLVSALKSFSKELIREITLLSEDEELPERWKGKISNELKKTALYLRDFRGEQLLNYDEKAMHAMYMIAKYSAELEAECTHQHNPADYRRYIAKESGYSPRHIERLYKDYCKYFSDEVSSLSPKRIAAIRLGIDQHMYEEIFKNP